MIYGEVHTSWISVVENLANQICFPSPLLCKQCGVLSYSVANK